MPAKDGESSIKINISLPANIIKKRGFKLMQKKKVEPQKKVDLDHTSTLEYQQKKTGRLFLGALGLLVVGAAAVMLHVGGERPATKEQIADSKNTSLVTAIVEKAQQVRTEQFLSVKALQEGLESLGVEYAGPLDLTDDQRIPGLLGVKIKLPDGETAPIFTTMDGKYLIPAIINMKTRQDYVQALLMQMDGEFAGKQPAFDIEKDWEQLAETHYIAMGSDNPKNIVYISYDPYCPHCNRLWQDKEKVGIPEGTQVRLIPVGFLSQQSADVAAYWIGLQSRGGDVLASIREHENLRAEGKALGIHDLIDVAAITQENINKERKNADDLIAFGARGTPTIFFKDLNGNPNMLPGRPRSQSMLMEILGHPKSD